MTPNDAVLDLAMRGLGARLAGLGWMLAAAESCTGGWLAKLATDIAGSSAWFERGFVSYSNEAKRDLLGVPESVLGRHGAVSEATVRAMAEGALANSRAQVAVAISGIAGPGGGGPDKPVGTVWIAWALRVGEQAPRVLAQHYYFPGGREAVRRQSLGAAIEGLLGELPIG